MDRKSFEVSHLETSPETGNPILPAQFAPSVRASAATQESKVTMSQPDTQVADKSDSTVEAKSIVVGTVDLQGHNDPGVPTQQKRKRRAAETLDTSSELPAKRPCRTRIAVVTGHPFAPNARRATGYSSPLVFEHPYAPTAPGATGRISTPVFEHPYAPTAPRPTNHTSGLTSVAYATEDNVNVRYAPINSHD